MDAGVDSSRFSIAFPPGWYPVARVSALGRRPVAATLMDTPLAVFRTASGPAVLVDRCPHRNVPLTMGRVTRSGELECGYHGWCFDRSGRCTAVPGLAADAPTDATTRTASALPALEQDGFVWAWSAGVGAGDREREPVGRPLRLPDVSGSGTGEVVFSYDLDCTMHAALENALDVPHTAFLHKGIFRGGEARAITAVRRPIDGGVEVQYLGEPVGLGRFRGDQGDLEFDHWDRFLLPCVAQVEYRVEGWLRIVNTIVHLPIGPFRTRAWFVVRFWTRVPASVVKPIVLARGRQILRQDARVLALQNDTIQRFGGERFTSTELDLMGNAIRRLLVGAEGGSGDVSVTERTVTLHV